MEKVMIILPEKIYFLKSFSDPISNSGYEEFSIYYENIIYPYNEVYDVEVISPHGNDYKRFWRVSGYTGDEPFNVTFKVYAAYGKLLCEKTVKMIPVEKNFNKEFNILCIGDSMTRSVTYMEHIQSKLYKVNFKGTRSFNGILYHEGRGGWTLGNYLEKTEEDPSPFLFPVGIDNYYGNMDFYNNTKNYRQNTYTFSGYYDYPEISEGQSYYSKGKLYSCAGEIISENVKWEFSFKKYAEKYNIGALDAVSLLFGANDMQISGYDKTAEHVTNFINNLEAIINSIKEYDRNIKIIINMPVPGADQNAWGMRSCLGSGKRYNYNMMQIGKAIIEKYGEEKNIFISPMAVCIDTIYGFSSQETPAMLYTEKAENHQNNWVHPQRAGYCQMGDALAAVIEKIRE